MLKSFNNYPKIYSHDFKPSDDKKFKDKIKEIYPNTNKKLIIE